jgi:hypothetical protein
LIEAVLPLPAERTPGLLADWLEAVILIEGRHVFSYSEVRARLVEFGEPDETSDVLEPADPQDRFEPIDDLDLYQAEIETIFREIEVRQRLAPDFYPFRRTNEGVQLTHNEWVWAYCFLLLLSLVDVPFRREAYSSAISRFFDWLCAHGCQRFLGDAVVERFGWPPLGDPRPGRPLSRAIEWVAKRAGLPFNAGVVTLPNENDAGVDLVVWRAFRDARLAFSVMLVQCTIARDFEKKSKDIDAGFWRAILGMQAEPITVLVLPYCVGDSSRDDWQLSCRRVQVVIDRMRLCELLETADPARAPFQDRISTWVQLKLEQLSFESAAV